MFAIPAGIVIWLVGNITIGGESIANVFMNGINPVAFLFGLNGVIVLAYIIAIPANEIVIPTVLMLTVMSLGSAGVGEGAGVMFELESIGATKDILTAGGWTLLTGINLLLVCSITRVQQLYTLFTKKRKV